MTWVKFIDHFFIVALSMVGVIYLFILLIDPYQLLSFSLDIERAPIVTNQRFSYPAIARNPSFDSVIIGTSTTRLLNPQRLDEVIGSHFANLSMNSATAFEQLQLFDLFARHHPALRYVVIGIDDSWCRRAKLAQRYTFRQFPEWMYDDNPWNDLLYLLNDKALESAIRMLEYAAGKREAKYQLNGYQDFTPDFGSYDLNRVRSKIYKSGDVARTAGTMLGAVEPSKGSAHTHYADLEHLKTLLKKVPETTPTILVLVPFHRVHISRGEENYSQCKGQLLNISADFPNVSIMDYMFDSPLTSNDANYWDVLHVRIGVADEIAVDIANVLSGVGLDSDDYRLLKVRN